MSTTSEAIAVVKASTTGEPIEVKAHEHCGFCGDRTTYEEYVSSADRAKGVTPRILRGTPHARCEATVKALASEREERRLFETHFAERIDDLVWRIEQLEGSRLRRFANRVRDAVDAFRGVRR